MKSPEILTGPTALQEAQWRASFGHKPYIWWVENETGHATRVSTSAIKRALLASGTQGKFYSIDTHGLMIMTWAMGLIWLRNVRRGYC